MAFAKIRGEPSRTCRTELVARLHALLILQIIVAHVSISVGPFPSRVLVTGAAVDDVLVSFVDHVDPTAHAVSSSSDCQQLFAQLREGKKPQSCLRRLILTLRKRPPLHQTTWDPH